MLLKRIHTSRKKEKDPINWRGHEVTRIEAFSDAIFGFAITLLIVSLEVPKSFEELMVNMKGFLPFAVSFLMFFQIWTTQNLFFRRYGMHDQATLMLNAGLLFTVLFFVYPMKFLWTAIFSGAHFLTEHEEMNRLVYIYSGGFAVIYSLFAFMYWHAYRCREHLKLTESEVFETHTFVYRNMVIASVGYISVIISASGIDHMHLSPLVYALIGPAMNILTKKREKLYKQKFGSLPDPEAVFIHEPVGEKVEVDE